MNEALSILIIDDSPDDRLLCQRSLRQAHQDTLHWREASSGESGLSALAEQQPHCVLLDYSLPKYNGIEVLRQLREKFPFLAVVMLTGQGSESIAVMAMQRGAQNYIAKDAVTPDTLAHAIRNAIAYCATQQRAHEQYAALEVFTHALAHDLKEPVRTTRLYVDLMEKYQHSPEKMVQYFRPVRTSVDRMAMLIDTVFTYTLLHSWDEAKKTDCAMEDILTETQLNLKQLIVERRARITHGPLPHAHVNHPQIIQLLQNLIVNAIRHSDHPVTIHLEAVERDGYWQFSLQDDGPGIPADKLRDVFSPFKRLGSKLEGAGLGLTICHKIVELHKGTIWCESLPGSGARFYFTIPVTQASPHTESATTAVRRNITLAHHS